MNGLCLFVIYTKLIIIFFVVVIIMCVQEKKTEKLIDRERGERERQRENILERQKSINIFGNNV